MMRFIFIFVLIMCQHVSGSTFYAELDQRVRCFSLEKTGGQPGVLIGTCHIASYEKILSPSFQEALQDFKHIVTEIDLNDTPEGSDTESCAENDNLQQKDVFSNTTKEHDEVTRIFQSFFTSDGLPPEAEAIYDKCVTSLKQYGFELCEGHKSLGDWLLSMATCIISCDPKKVCESAFDYVIMSEITAYRSHDVIDYYIARLSDNDNAAYYVLETADVRKKAYALEAEEEFPCLDLKIESDNPYSQALLWYSGICELLLLKHNPAFTHFIEETKKGHVQQCLPFLQQEGERLIVRMVDKQHPRVKEYYFGDSIGQNTDPDMIYRNRHWKNEIPKILLRVAGERFIIAAGAKHLNVYDPEKQEELGLIDILKALGYTVTEMARNADGLFDMPSF
ncbi:MAG TPA: hypothetical protein DIC42_05030 [Holosporales bacterium]|nr:hypothetical protein [Holosporales bacterium]